MTALASSMPMLQTACATLLASAAMGCQQTIPVAEVMVSKPMTSALTCLQPQLGSMHAADEHERRCTGISPWLMPRHYYIRVSMRYTALPAHLQTKPASSTRCCPAAGDCFPGLVCTYTAKAAYATCVQPVSTGQACGARLGGQVDAIGKAS